MLECLPEDHASLLGMDNNDRYESWLGAVAGSGAGDANVSLVSSSAAPRRQTSGVSKAEKSTIHAFYHQILKLFKDAFKAGGCPHCLTGRAKATAEQCLSLLYMWAQGLDLHHLERGVEEDSELQATVVSALTGIAKIITSDLFPFGQHHKDEIDLSLVSSYSDSTQQWAIDSDSSDSDSDEDNDDDDDGRSTTQRHLRSLHQLHSHVTGLMDLLPTLHHSCNLEALSISEISQTKPRTHSGQSFAVRPYVLQVHDKFKTINDDLANRLGEANWQRYLHLQALAKQMNARASGSAAGDETDSDDEEEEEGEPDPGQPSFVPVTVFHDSGLGSSIPAKSSYAVSTASHSSFLSTQSAAGRGVARVPPTPLEVEEGKPFRCSICGQLLGNVRTRVDWKLHVFTDLQPYICTVDDCKIGNVTFPTRKLWADHEFQSHRSREVFRCFSCPAEVDLAEDYLAHLKDQHDFSQNTDEARSQALLSAAKASVIKDMKDQTCHICSRTGFKSQREFISHVGRHMEEIALITLSREVDSDDEADGDDGMSVSSLQIEDAPADKDEDEHEAIIPEVSEIPATDIIPTLEGFKRHALSHSPDLQPYLRHRIAQEQLRRFNKLVEAKTKHTQNVEEGKRCPSGKYCFDLGGEGILLTPRRGRDPVATPTTFLILHDRAMDVVMAGNELQPAEFPASMPLPPVDQLPAEFECPLCFKVKKFHKPTDWTKHVHEDLQPFTCTFPECKDTKSFKRTADWVRHENERHRHLEWWSCNLEDCVHVCYRKDNFVQHLVREHKMLLPRVKGRGGGVVNAAGDPKGLADDPIWRVAESCRVESASKAQDEPCRFCGRQFPTFKKLSVHLGEHLVRIAMPVLELVKMRQAPHDEAMSPKGKP